MQDSVLITGGAQRLGRALVLAFARAGWHVWCHYGQSAQAAQALQADLRAQGLAVDVVAADLSQEAQVLAMMAQIAQQRGPVRGEVLAWILGCAVYPVVTAQLSLLMNGTGTGVTFMIFVISIPVLIAISWIGAVMLIWGKPQASPQAGVITSP